MIPSFKVDVVVINSYFDLDNKTGSCLISVLKTYTKMVVNSTESSVKHLPVSSWGHKIIESAVE